MAFQSAQSARVYVGQLAAAAYARSASTDSATDLHDVSVLTDTSKQFVVGHESSSFAIAGPLDPDASSDAQYDAITSIKGATTPTPISYLPLGSVDKTVWMVEGDETDITTMATVAGTVDWSLAAQATGQTDFNGVVIEDNTTVTADTNGTAHTAAAGSTNGGVAHLHVTAYSGLTSDDIIIEGSGTGAFAGEEVTVATFAQVTGLGAERVEVTGTVGRYLRVVDDVLGTGSITRFVSFARR